MQTQCGGKVRCGDKVRCVRRGTALDALWHEPRQRQQRARQRVIAFSEGSYDVRRELGRALRSQAGTQIQKLRQELVDPWFAPPAQPLLDTVEPELLSDDDSCFIDVQGLKVHYKICKGDPSQPAVLMMHGFNGSTFNWRDVMQPLSDSGHGEKKRTVIAFDRPPFGLTQRPLTWEGGAEADPYSCKGGARLAGQLLDALGIETAVLCGHSMGAAVAMEMLRMRPQQVAGLILVSPALPAWPDAFRRSMTVGQQLQSLARLALMRSDTAGLVYVRNMLTKQAARVAEQGTGVHHDKSAGMLPDVVKGYLKPMKAINWDRGSLLGFRAFSFPDDIPRYEAIEQPVLLVQGAEDSTIPRATALKIAERLETRSNTLTKYVEFDQCGHIPMEECPSAFVHALDSFLAEMKGGKASRAGGPMPEKNLQHVADTLPVAAAGTSAAAVQAVD